MCGTRFQKINFSDHCFLKVLLSQRTPPISRYKRKHKKILPFNDAKNVIKQTIYTEILRPKTLQSEIKKEGKLRKIKTTLIENHINQSKALSITMKMVYNTRKIHYLATVPTKH